MQLGYTPTAIAQLGKLPVSLQKRITDKVDFYVAQPNPLVNAKYLTDLKVYRFRIGEYRVIFECSKNTIVVLLIQKRDKAYKDL